MRHFLLNRKHLGRQYGNLSDRAVAMINKRIMQQHFSLRAATYDAYAAVQREMAQELINIVTGQDISTDAPLHILDIGCGTGLLTQMLADTFPQARITAVDIAPGMIATAQKKITHGNVTFRCEDIEEVTFAQSYDLIVSNATFQWLHSVGATVKKLYDALTPSGLLCFSTFGDQTFTELHQSYAQAKQEAGLDTLHAPGQSFHSLSELLVVCHEALPKAGARISGKEIISQERFPTVRDFLESIKRIGANNTNANHAIPTSVVRRMIQIYSENFTENAQVKATYHNLFLSVQKI
jgi:malonyl-CoA O-methyltransferase